MRILLISNSARGEAIADALSRSPQKPQITVISTVKSPGFSRYGCELIVEDINSFSKIVEIAKTSKPDFAFIAPDDPIGAGLTDRLESIGIPCVAPKKTLARIESSKGFARNLLKKYNIDGSPQFRVFSFSSVDTKKQLEVDIRTYIEHDLRSQYVVKYDALKGGKGVKVSGEHLPTIDSGAQYAMECIEQCGTVVIEEKLMGVEFSLLSFVSGTMTVDMPAVQDYKRARQNDEGPNTGGMGTYSDANHSLPFLTEADIAAASAFNRSVAAALMDECNTPYKGILYGGFIATSKGVKVIEYNARFGDPEALNILPLLETDFVAICKAIIDGTLSKEHVRFASKATVCKYVTPRSYPEDRKEKGQRILVPDTVPDDVRLYYGDVSSSDTGGILLGSSRSIGVVGIGESIHDAEEFSQSTCEKIEGPVRFRTDIATSDSIQKRIDLLRKVRGD
jgi:phosphoribosylamine--glycine ligase